MTPVVIVVVGTVLVAVVVVIVVGVPVVTIVYYHDLNGPSSPNTHRHIKFGIIHHLNIEDI